ISAERTAQMESTVAMEKVRQPENGTSVNTHPTRVFLVTLPMTLGIISNIVALCILATAYRRQRRRSKATFLLFATSLVVTDFFGHLVPGALVLCLYSGGITSDCNSLCQILGGSMVFFGLCPLFLGCAMAAERCLGITKPLLHASLVTKTRAKVCLLVIWVLALCVAILPCFKLGSYTYQHPGKWSFVNVLNETKEVDVAFVALFSGLCLTLLLVALVCNTLSGVTLVLARFKRSPLSRRSAKSNDIEMVVQLVGIMTTSCICWCPLLITLTHASLTGSIGGNLSDYQDLMYLGVRLATWNQILDPWVYILLRRSVLRKIYLIVKCQAQLNNHRLGRWEPNSFAGSL
uniref:Thromboxane A2 receptor n=1 Tax=Tetraodon nigroviridis TaxID=99883 RepID=H3D3D2_TETNG